MRTVVPPRGLFAGTNIMTPNISAYYAIDGGYAELSYGRGIANEPIFGVTIRPESAGKSHLFHDESKALSYIRSLTP